MLQPRPFAAACALAFAAAYASMPGDASAQQIYKIVGPDGRVTFSDKPPTDPNVKANTAPTVPLGAGGGSGLAALPFELRQAASRYPVTLYTSPSCTTCATGRALLVRRGIPFAERTVSSKEDIDALARLTNNYNSVPVLAIGGQQLKGYSDSEWTQFLDAAGYPKTSQLPPSYVPPAATPLVALDQPRPAAEASAAPPARQPAAPAQPPAQNPAGIQF